MRFVKARHDLRAEGKSRLAEEIFGCDDDTARHLVRTRHAVYVERPDWATHNGLELQTVAIPRGSWTRVVACLNIWNDLPALRATIDSWYPHVDAVIAVDGAYRSTGATTGASTDGTREFLRSLPKVELIEREDPWPDQREKRNAYFQAARAGDLLFVVDADEVVVGAEALRQAPDLDVGWVTLENDLYARTYRQPRVFRANPALNYRGRHHWVFRGDELLATHQYGGLALHATVPLTLTNHRGLGHTEDRAAAKRRHLMMQFYGERSAVADGGTVESDAHTGAREPLRILQTTLYDAGLAPSRFHSALNATTPHTSMFLRAEDGGPFGAPAQFETPRDSWVLDALLSEADVFHAHLTLRHFVTRRRELPKMVVLHHHGSMYRAQPDYHTAHARAMNALVLVSTLELLRYGPAHWLPNPMPVRRYERLRQACWQPHEGFRVAHSPSKRHIKGTDAFLGACDRLQARGIPIEPVLIEGVAHSESMAIKATCDAAFDSFWLGIQCSGLEAAAMGMPVIAGDSFVAARYREEQGALPYTFAADGEELEHVLEQLATDAAFRRSEALRVTEYVRTVHDEAAVALRYLDLLDTRFHWRDGLTIHKPRPTKTHRPPPLQSPVAPPTETPRREPLEVR